MSTLNLKEQLEQKEKEFHLQDDIFGMTLLTNPGYISSSRSVMFTSHLRQLVDLVNPDIPKVFTNYENTVGKLSTGYYKAKEEYGYERKQTLANCERFITPLLKEKENIE